MTRYTSHWRDQARPIIAKVLEEHKNSSDQDLKKALFNAYPFGERKYYPYKCWLLEIASQLKTNKRYVARKRRESKKQAAAAPVQMSLI